ncbi:MAG: hypothetical protein ABL893_01870 [Hyphomicrobium sp.]
MGGGIKSGMAARVLVICLAFAAVAALTATAAKTIADRHGWRSIKPGGMHWTGLWLSAALTGFMSFIFLFVGSARADAAQQMQILFWLIVVFGLATIASAVSVRVIRRSAARWRGEKIAFTLRGAEQTRSFADVTGLQSTPFGGVVVSFRDGVGLRLDPHARGAQELIEQIDEHLAARAG